MTRRMLLAVAVLLVLSAPLSAARRRSVGQTPALPVTPERWVQGYAIPFATTEARTGLADLEPLRQIVGNARVVSLGEATHGSREMFTMKHRMLEFLVEKMGFTVFVIEANLTEADRVDDYVMHGIGDAASALRGMYFWTWDTDEVLDMIEWMREYNLRRGDRPPVRFRGFDAQFAHYTAPKIEEYVGRVDPARAADVRKSYDCIRGYQNGSTYRGLSPSARQSCRTRVVDTYNAIKARRAEYIARSSAEEFERHLRYARVVVQTEGIWSNLINRDAAMAENVVYFAGVAHPGEKLVLWAHNAHVATNWRDQQGAVLLSHFGDDMVVFGFAFDRGGFTSIGPAGLGPQSIDSSLNEGWDRLFRAAGHPLFFLDLRNTPSRELTNYLGRAQTMWSIGSLWDPRDPWRFRWSVGIAAAFDVIIYIEQTTASRLRPR